MPHLRRRQRGFLGGRINRESLKTSQSDPGRVTLFFLYRSNRKYATQAQPFPIDTELEISPLHQRFFEHLRRSDAELFLEGVAEVAHVVEASHHGGLSDIVFPAAQQCHGAV